jgi:CHAT domain-containing protein
VVAYQGPQALEDVLKRIGRPRVLHLATHGFYLAPRPWHDDDWQGMFSADVGAGRFAAFERLWAVGNDNPLLRSGLVLAGANRLGEAADGAGPLDDGWLTAMEVAGMDLRGTELVVLSACESGLGDIRFGDGVDGLRRAFLYAGARTLVISLFPVPDAATHDLMAEFYAGVRGGRGKLAALRDAQLRMIQQRRAQTGAAHPWFWGGFVLLGDPQ